MNKQDDIKNKIAFLRFFLNISAGAVLSHDFINLLITKRLTSFVISIDITFTSSYPSWVSYLYTQQKKKHENLLLLN